MIGVTSVNLVLNLANSGPSPSKKGHWQTSHHVPPTHCHVTPAALASLLAPSHLFDTNALPLPWHLPYPTLTWHHLSYFCDTHWFCSFMCPPHQTLLPALAIVWDLYTFVHDLSTTLALFPSLHFVHSFHKIQFIFFHSRVLPELTSPLNVCFHFVFQNFCAEWICSRFDTFLHHFVSFF